MAIEFALCAVAFIILYAKAMGYFINGYRTVMENLTTKHNEMIALHDAMVAMQAATAATP